MPKQTIKKKRKFTPRVINVIEVIQGVVNTPRSFIVKSKKLEQNFVNKAEGLFIRLAAENGMNASDAQEALDNGNFDDGNGYEVIINWSEVQ